MSHERGNPEDMSESCNFRMPGEWECHAATWLSWPRRSGLSFPDEHWDRARPEYLALVRRIAESEPVYLNVIDDAETEEVLKEIGSEHADRVHPFVIPTDEPWCRDHGPTFVLDPTGRRIAIDWDYNAWGEKYKPYDRDRDAALAMAKAVDAEVIRPAIVLEGGALEVDGRGHLLTTASCLLHPRRNPGHTREEIESIFRGSLGVDRISWLCGEIPGDDTDSHIDTFARFASPTVILSAVDPDELEETPGSLDGIEVIRLPDPPPVTWEGRPLPASYANFVITNRSVLVPGYEASSDQRAAAILREHFPSREIHILPSLELIYGLGSFHCLTQQLPAEQIGEDEGNNDRCV